MPAPRTAPRDRGCDSPMAQARIASGLTQKQLADLLGVYQKDVSAWEKGEREPRFSVGVRIARILGVPAESLVLQDKPKRRMYPAVFTYEGRQKIAVTFPDLNAATGGKDDDDAFSSARELLSCVLHGLVEDGKPIPQPTSLHQITLAPNERTVLIDTVMPADRSRKPL